MRPVAERALDGRVQPGVALRPVGPRAKLAMASPFAMAAAYVVSDQAGSGFHPPIWGNYGVFGCSCGFVVPPVAGRGVFPGRVQQGVHLTRRSARAGLVIGTGGRPATYILHVI